MTPNGVVVETNEAGELRLAPTEAQMYRVGQNGEMIRRAAEEDTVETEASREAAQATAPPPRRRWTQPMDRARSPSSR